MNDTNIKDNKCPNCGAQVQTDSYSNKCDYCGSSFNHNQSNSSTTFTTGQDGNVDVQGILNDVEAMIANQFPDQKQWMTNFKKNFDGMDGGNTNSTVKSTVTRNEFTETRVNGKVVESYSNTQSSDGNNNITSSININNRTNGFANTSSSQLEQNNSSFNQFQPVKAKTPFLTKIALFIFFVLLFFLIIGIICLIHDSNKAA